ncbi:uncharacterized protein LOC117511637 [Thalassophryne amazonica]|uniref:uncharacterized protein LOC117511637 n=1 Tax=Thalassophryne amazonica TaxID=390379 RepID=UPI0014717F15|nr:uncharacterized protein LOC117511637 [Thalassophryne amazonica]
MKFTLVFLLLIEIPHLKGQQRIYQYGHILLKFEFDPFYNSYHKSCCKLYPNTCYPLLDSTGFTAGFLKGRVTKTETNGCIQFTISNAQFVDAGYYRCTVLGSQFPVYSDYVVEVSEVPGQRWPLPAQTATPKTTYITETQQDPTRPELAQDHSDGPRVPWSSSLMVTAIVSTTALVFITSLITAVCCRIKGKHNRLSK